jgi:large subunit ribosomal protein L21
MYAIVRTGGKQYKVKPGDKFAVEKLTGDKGTVVSLSDVLLIAEENDANPMIGTPVVADAKVDCEVVSQTKSQKVIFAKFKKRKRYLRKQGHRQDLTMLKVKNISCGSKNWEMKESK